jgi:hydrogenase nickel incorporation protein HypA/HybF
MHELSIAISILDLAEEETRRHGCQHVFDINLRLGPLSGVVKEALISAFEIARLSSPFDKAQLVIEEIPVRVKCPTCQALRAVVSMQELCCVKCGAPSPDVVSGRDLEVVTMEIQ